MGIQDLTETYGVMQKKMLASLNCSRIALSHSTQKGNASEADWIAFYRAYLPKRYAVTKGRVIDHTGRQSDQIDIIIYDAQYTHIVFNSEGNEPLVTAESVYAAFEVKQTLNAEFIADAAKKGESIRKLERTSVPVRNIYGVSNRKPLHNIIIGLLTTDCDWLKNSAQEITLEKMRQLSFDERLDIVCSLSGHTLVADNPVFVEEPMPEGGLVVHCCEDSNSLVFMLLHLLKKLQDIGTAPAIDLMKYAERIPSTTILYENR